MNSFLASIRSNVQLFQSSERMIFDTLSSIGTKYPILGNLGRLVRWIPVLIVTVFLMVGFWGYNFLLCYGSFYVNGFEKTGIICSVIFNFLWITGMISFMKAIFTNPGYVPQTFIDKTLYHMNQSENPQRSDMFRGDKEADPGCIPVGGNKENFNQFLWDRQEEARKDFSIICRRCDNPRPPRSHHCRQCGRCVCRMDHHCPVLNNCVGFGNYKYFLLTVGYAMLGCLFGCFVVVVALSVGALSFQVSSGKNQLISTGLYIGGAQGIGLLFFFGFHMYLVFANLSTLDIMAIGIRTLIQKVMTLDHSFNLGWKRNFTTLFGKNPLLWFLPVFTSEGDGCSYETNDSFIDYVSQYQAGGSIYSFD